MSNQLEYNTGVYCWTCRVTGKVYIGGAYRSFSKRFSYYRKSLPLGKCHNKHFQSAWNKYGARNFTLRILERCPPDKVAERETWWILELAACNPMYGYNVLLFGGSRLGSTHTEATKRKIGAAMKGRVIDPAWRKKLSDSVRYTMSGSLIREKISEATKRGLKGKVSHWRKGKVKRD